MIVLERRNGLSAQLGYLRLVLPLRLPPIDVERYLLADDIPERFPFWRAFFDAVQNFGICNLSTARGAVTSGRILS